MLCLTCWGIPAEAQSFIRVSNGHLMRDGSPYYYVGTNLWYAPILASEGQGGDRERLGRELDRLQAMGIDNLRILVGADTGSDSANTTTMMMAMMRTPVFRFK